MATGVRNPGQHLLESTNLDLVDEDFENFIDYEIGTDLDEKMCMLISGEEHTDLMQ